MGAGLLAMNVKTPAFVVPAEENRVSGMANKIP